MKLGARAIAREVNSAESQLDKFPFNLICNTAERWELRFSAIKEVSAPQVDAKVFATNCTPVRLKFNLYFAIDWKVGVNVVTFSSVHDSGR